MAVYLVTRHPGARDWAKEKGLAVDHIVGHLDPQTTGQGDIVIGTLPVHLAAEVCSQGARYLHLSMQMPPALRGRELSAADMRACQARIEEFRIVFVGRYFDSEPAVD